jgi:hypothetical protein
MLTVEAARQLYPEDATHGFEHILQVLQLAELIARQDGADLEIVRAAALLHDAVPPASLPLPLPQGGRGRTRRPAGAPPEFGGFRPPGCKPSAGLRSALPPCSTHPFHRFRDERAARAGRFLRCR